jgi:hypothetical protein
LNSEAKKTAPASCCPVAFGIRHSAFVILSALACSFPLSSSAEAQPLANAAAVASIDGFDCITAYEVEEEPAQVCDISPDPWNDLDEISAALNDKAVIPSRYDQETPHFTGTIVDSISLRPPGFVPAFLFLAHSSDSLPEHICERAPPGLT